MHSLPIEEHKNVEKVIRYFLLFLPPRGSESILNIGCGRTDPYGGMLKTRCEQYGSLDIRPSPKVMFVYDLSDRTPFACNEWDWGWCSETIEHIPQNLQEQVVKEIMRVCRNCVFTYPKPELTTFNDDPGHVEVIVDWEKYNQTHEIINKSTKNGRGIYMLKSKEYKTPKDKIGLFLF